MPAQSKSQQRLFGMVAAYKKTGKLPDDPSLAAKIREMADGSGNRKGISKKDAEDFASTKHKGLPEQVKEETMESFKEFYLTEAKARAAIKRSKNRKAAYAAKMTDEEDTSGTRRSFTAKHMDKGGRGGSHVDRKKGSKKGNRRQGKQEARRESRFFG